jgi:hypothetical protein
MGPLEPNPKLAGFSNGEIAAAVHNTDNRFRNWNGTVDLLEMSQALTPEYFRLYIDASREYRLRRRKETA